MADNPALSIFWKNRYAPAAGIAASLLLILHMAPDGIDQGRQTLWAAMGIVLIVGAVLDVVRPSFGSKVTSDGLPITVHIHAGLSGLWLGGSLLIDPVLARTNEYAYLVAVLVLGVMIGLLQFGTLGRHNLVLMASSVITSAIGFFVVGQWELALASLFLLAVGLQATIVSSRAYLELLTLRAESLDREQSAMWHANHDPLTSVLNRRGLAARLDSSNDVATGATIHCLFIDLDHFKMINDGHGHDVGDQVLRVTAERLSERVAGADIVARLGGDEFVVLIDSAGRAPGFDALDFAKQMLTALREPIVVEGETVAVSASVGVVPAGSGETLRELLRRGDAALYNAKSSGRGRVVLKA